MQAYRYLVEKLRQGRLLNGNPAFAGVGIGTDFGAPVPVFAAPRFMVSGDVTGFAADADLEFLRGLFVGGPRPDAGRCHVSGERPMVDYASGFTSRLAGELRFFKSETPWDGRASQPGYDVVPGWACGISCLGQRHWAYTATWAVSSSTGGHCRNNAGTKSSS